MKTSIVATALLTLAASSAAQEACSRVHILVGRGSGEPAGMGATGRLVTQMKAAITGVTAEAIDYPAKLSPYPDSSSAGTNAAVKQTTAYVKRCPNAKIVLMGYSQGADIVGSALCGHGLKNSAKLSADVGSHVAAAVLFGDPRTPIGKGAPFVYELGTTRGKSTGGMIKPLMGACPAYAPKIAAFCDVGDTFCDMVTAKNGSGGGKVHGSYLGRYSKAALDFVKAKVG